MLRIAEASIIGKPETSSKAILDVLGKFDAEVFHNQVLVAGYVQPSKTKGGILTTDRARDEDMYQGSVGLVIGLGKGAFQDDRVAQFHGVKLKLGDWVLYRPADGLGVHINSVPCRLFQDSLILMRIADPNLFWS